MSPETERSRWPKPEGRAVQRDPYIEGEWSEPADSMALQREQATQRIKARRIQRFHVIFRLYVIVNALLIVSWVLCAVIGWSSYFPWYLPVITIVLWGLLVVRIRSRAYEVNAYPAEQVQREMQQRP
jgi:fatty acid desaturase